MKRPADIDPNLDWKPRTRDQSAFADAAVWKLVALRREAAMTGVPWTTLLRRCDTVYQRGYDYDSDR